MFLFFYGPNDYLIHRQVQKIKTRYKEKSGGDLNLTTLDGTELLLDEYVRQIQAVPLLAASRLVIIKDILKNKDKSVLDYIKKSLEKIPSSTVVVFVEAGEPDKRLGLFKTLNKPKISRYFSNLENSKTKKFILDEVKIRGGKIENSAVEALATAVGSDLWRLSNEIDKLICYSKDRAITTQDIKLQVAEFVEGNVFTLIDNLARGQKAEAFNQLESLIVTGEPPLRILSLVNYQYRTIAQVKEAQESTGGHTISKSTGLSPFQIGKTQNLARRYSWNELALIYDKMLEIDVSIKTGKISGDAGLKELVLNI